MTTKKRKSTTFSRLTQNRRSLVPIKSRTFKSAIGVESCTLKDRILRLGEGDAAGSNVGLSRKKETFLQRLVNSTIFTSLISGVIMTNAIQIGLETDDKGPDGVMSHENLWNLMELVFLAIYGFEIFIRIAAFGWENLSDPNLSGWFIFDVTVVTFSAFDVIGLTDLLPATGSVVVLRVVRLCKLVRIVRLFRFCNELLLLVSSLFTALKTVVWMWVLLGLVIYVFSILFCNELGHQYPNDVLIQEWWGSVIRSCFSLFAILTLETWVDLARHIWDSAPLMLVLMVIFISITTYAIVNVVVAVIVQHVVDAALSRQDETYKRLEDELQEKTEALAEVFSSADADEDGSLTKREFNQAIENPEIQRLLRNMDLDMRDLSSLFDQIDINGDGTLCTREFVQGVLQVRGPARARRLFELHCDFSKFTVAMEQCMTQHEEAISDINREILTQNRNILASLAGQDKKMTAFQQSLEDLAAEVRLISANQTLYYEQTSTKLDCAKLERGDTRGETRGEPQFDGVGKSSACFTPALHLPKTLGPHALPVRPMSMTGKSPKN